MPIIDRTNSLTWPLGWQPPMLIVTDRGNIRIHLFRTDLGTRIWLEEAYGKARRDGSRRWRTLDTVDVPAGALSWTHIALGAKP